MVTVDIPQELIITIIAAIVVYIFSSVIWPWKTLKENINEVRKDIEEIEEGNLKFRKEMLQWEDSLKNSIQEVKTLNQSVSVIADKIGLKGDLYAWGRLMFFEGKLDEAIYTFDELLEQEPDHDSAHRYRGLCHFREGNYRRAVDDLQLAVNTNKKNGELRLSLAKAYYRARMPSVAEREATKALDLGVSEVLSAKILIGQSRHAMKKYDKAIEIFEECPLTDSNAVSGKGKALFEKSKTVSKKERLELLDELINHYEKAISVNPQKSNYFNYTYRAQGYSERGKQGDWKAALNDWKKAKEIWPRSPVAFALQGDAMYERAFSSEMSSKGEIFLKKALKNFEEAIWRSSEDRSPVFRNKISLVYQALGQYEVALKETKTGLDENPNFVTNFMACATAAISAYDWTNVIEASNGGLDIPKKLRGAGGTIWCLFFRIIGRCGSHHNIELIIEDCKALAKEMKNFSNFNPEWDWLIAKKRVEDIMENWPSDFTSIIQDSIALINLDLSPQEYLQKINTYAENYD